MKYHNKSFSFKLSTFSSKKAFTLVELIIVITILAILATIAFTSFQGYSLKARNSNRQTTIKSIEKGLGLYLVKTGFYPMPENPTNINASGTTISKQGYFGAEQSNAINMTSIPLDPSDSGKYIYSINANNKEYQLLTYMEGNSELGYIKEMYAYDYSDRTPKTYGAEIGIILDSNNNLVTLTGGLDVSIGSTNYKVIFSATESITASGNSVFSNIYNRRLDLIDNKDLSSLDESLVGYWDMKSLTSSGKLKDLSKYGKNGAYYNFASNNTSLGIKGKSTNFDGLNDHIGIDDNANLKYNGTNQTISVRINPNSNEIDGGYIISKPWNGSGWYNYNLVMLGNKIVFKNIRGITASGYNLFSNSIISPNVWTNITVTSDNNRNMRMYINGVFEIGSINNSTQFSSIDGGDLNLPLSIGASYVYGNNRGGLNYVSFNGLIDEVRIYNRALSDEEVKELYNATK